MEKQIPAMMAGTTAIIADLCELLIAKNVIDRTELRDRLYRLLNQAISTKAEPGATAPIDI